MNRKTTFLTIFSYITLVLFLLSAAAQYNDPDGIYWMGIYGMAALVTGFFTRNKLHWIFPAAMALAVLIWAGFLTAEILGQESFGSGLTTWQMQNPVEEKTREAGGLFFIGVWMSFLAFYTRK